MSKDTSYPISKRIRNRELDRWLLRGTLVTTCFFVGAAIAYLAKFGMPAGQTGLMIFALGGLLMLAVATTYLFYDRSRLRRSYYAERSRFRSRIQSTQTDNIQQVNKSRRDFLSNVNHELRTPLNGVIGMIGLLQETELHAKQKHYLEAANQSSEKLVNVINDLLDLSRIEADVLEFENLSFDMQIMAEEVVEQIAKRFTDQSVELFLDFEPGTPRHVIGDPGRTRQILGTLLSQALKYSRNSHVVVKISAEKVSDARGDEGKVLQYHFSVIDEDAHLQEEQYQHVAALLSVNGDQVPSQTEASDNLSVSLCKSLCRLMGGSMGVQYIPDQGTQFWFDASFEKCSRRRSELPDVNLNLNGLRVLVIDDSQTNRIILQGQLKTYNIESDAAASGSEAIQILKQAASENRPYDMALLDYRMPGINGARLGRMIKQTPGINKTHLIMLTSAPQRGDGRKMSEFGFSGYLLKPVHIPTLVKVMATIWSAVRDGHVLPFVNQHTLREIEAQQAARQANQLIFKQAKVLVVEDNRISQEIARRILEKYDCVVTTADDGFEAIQCVEKERFDLILMDCQMPGIDGFEATQAIKKFFSENGVQPAPILALTAYAMQGDRERCLQAGMDDYIPKPIRQETLEKMLIKWLPARKRWRQEVV